MKVLITGGTGFIGHHATAELKAAGHDVVIASRRPLSVPHLNIDLAAPSKESLEAVKNGSFDALLMLAWETEHGKFWAAPSNALWCATSIQLLEAFLNGGGQRVVCAGTCVEYCSTDTGPCHSANTQIAPVHPYSLSKDAFRRVAEWMTRDRGANFIWGRIFLAFGPYEDPRRLVPSVINCLLAGKPTKCSSGKQIRDFSYSPNLGAAFAALMECDFSGTLNVCSGEPRTIAEVVIKIGEMMDRRDLIELGALDDRPAEPKNLWGETDTFSNITSFRAKHSFEDSLSKTIHWWRENRLLSQQ